MPPGNEVSSGTNTTLATITQAAQISDPGQKEPASEADRKYSLLCSLYIPHATEYDKGMVTEWNSDMDILLIFAALFSAIVTAFMAISINDLKEDFLNTNSQLLRILIAQSQGQKPPPDPPLNFEADSSAVTVNSLWATSLIISVGSALGAIFCKQFLRGYMARLPPTPKLRVSERHRRFSAFKRWHVHVFVALLPVILHMAALLFFAGLVVYLKNLDRRVGNVSVVIVGIIGIGYVAFIFLPLFTTAPFGTPVTAILIKLMTAVKDYMLTLIFAAYLFIKTVIPAAFKDRTCIKTVEMFTKWKVVVWNASRSIVRGAIQEQPRSYGWEDDSHCVEISSWLVPLLQDPDDMEQVVEFLSEVKSPRSQRILEVDGIDNIVLRHLQYSCFSRTGSGAPMQLIPGRLHFALSCLDILSAIESSASTTVQNATWMGRPTDEMLNILLQATSGHDQLRVLAASVWLVNDHNKSLFYRRVIRTYVVEHIDGEEEIEDHIMKALVDALHPSLDIIPYAEMKRLLEKYLDREVLPSTHCFHSILFNLYNRSLKRGDSDNPANRCFTNMHFIAHLLKTYAGDRSLYLRLIRKLPSVPGHGSIADANLSKCLFDLLEERSLEDTLVEDVLKTISFTPTSCHARSNSLYRLVKVYERQTSESISRAAIKAVASYMTSIFQPYTPHYGSVEYDGVEQVQKAVRIITKKLINLPDISIDAEIVRYSTYVLSIACNNTDSAFSKTDDYKPLGTKLITLLRTLSNERKLPERGVAFTRHALQVIRGIIIAKESMAQYLAKSADVLKNLAVNDDSRIRWLTFEILIRLSFHSSRDEMNTISDIFKSVRDDIEERLRSENVTQFIDFAWEDLTNAKKILSHKRKDPEVVIINNINDAIDSSDNAEGIRKLLGEAPKKFMCMGSVHVADDFPWWSDFTT